MYYDVDDVSDAITINIRLTKANYNRMWEIKVNAGNGKLNRCCTYTIYVFVDYSNRIRSTGAGRVSPVLPGRDGYRADDEFRDQRSTFGRPGLRDLHTTGTE